MSPANEKPVSFAVSKCSVRTLRYSLDEAMKHYTHTMPFYRMFIVLALLLSRRGVV
jgi:hypothetical protein